MKSDFSRWIVRFKHPDRNDCSGGARVTGPPRGSGGARFDTYRGGERPDRGPPSGSKKGQRGHEGRDMGVNRIVMQNGVVWWLPPLRARDEAERKTQMLERANRDLDVANETVRQLSDQQHRYLIQSNPI